MNADSRPGRRAKGVNFIGLVKLLKIHGRTHPLIGLSANARALLSERILVSNWYSLELLLELLELTYEHMLGRDPEQAIAMGVTGGKQIWGEMHRSFVESDSCMDNLLAMRHTWANYFDFGTLRVTAEGQRSVLFTVEGYPDIPEVHAMTVVGWHLAVAHLGGNPDATVDILGRPWQGDPALIYRVTL